MNIEQSIKMTVSSKAEDATGKKLLLESIQTCEKNINNDVGHSDVASAKKQVQETALSSDITSDHKEQFENHKGGASTATDHHNTHADSLPSHASLCITSFESFGGFKTASNKNIHISEKNLRKGELLFKEDDPIHHNSHPLLPAADFNNTLDVADSTSPFIGFRTASSKEIVVSESKIAKGILLFKDIEDGKCENITKEDLLLRPTANMVSGNEKEKEVDNIVEPLSMLSSEETKDKNQTSNPITLGKQSTKEVRPKGMTDQNILFLQHGKDSTSNEKSQRNKKTSLPSEIQSRFCEILTESQKAEVNELSSILENADSQYDFTQIRKTGIVTSSDTNQNMQSAEDGISESENLNNSDVWKDVDFNDSFAAGAEKVEMDSGVKLSLKREGITVGATACDSGVTLIPEKSVSKEIKFGGFSLASGKCINITDEDMIKAFELFSDLDDTTLLVNHTSTEVNKRTLLVNSSVPATLNVQQAPKDRINVPQHVKESSILNSKAESSPTFEERSSTSNVCTLNIEGHNSKTKLMSEFVFDGSEVSGSAEAFCVQNINNVSCGDFASTSCVSAMPVGFSTGKGKVISVDKAALAKAKDIFNDILHPEGVYKNQGVTSRVVVEENITVSQGEESKVIHGLAVEQSASFITSGEGAVVAPDLVQIARQIVEHEPGSELAHCMSSPKKDAFAAKRMQFSTAHGKPIHLSDESLKRARERFADIDNQQLGTVGENSKVLLCEVEKISTKSSSINKLQDLSSIAQQDKEPVLPPLGFSTASGKSVVVSSDSLQKARIMFAEADVAIHEGLEPVESHDGDQPNPAEIKLKKQKIKEDWDVTMKKNMAIVLPSLGFSTASGKTVAVSNESLQKARLMLADTDSDMIHEFQSSETRCGISNRELCKNRVLCASENTKPGKVHLAKRNSVKPFVGESTADFRLEKSDFPSIVSKPRFPETREVNLPQKNAPNIRTPSFSTAGGKPVQMSDEALRKARDMFAGIDDGQLEDPCSFNQSVDQTTKGNNMKSSNLLDLTSSTVTAKGATLALPAPGFSTATRKTVAVSADALHKAENAPNIRTHSFSTAGGKPVQMSDEALRKAREMFAGIDGQLEDPCSFNHSVDRTTKGNNMKSSNLQDLTSTVPAKEATLALPAPGFSTATRKTVAVSADALHKAENAPNIRAPSFSTAGGKPVQMSDEAFRKAREMFVGIDGQLEDQCSFKQSEDRTTKRTNLQSSNLQDLTSSTLPAKEATFAIPAPGFSTASGKTVAESADTLHKPDNAPNIRTPSFSTAGGKPVQTSDEALRKAREMFAGIDNEQLEDPCSFNQSVDRTTKRNNLQSSNLLDLTSSTVSEKETTLALPAPGFSTARGKTVAVSADALHKARLLLADNDDNHTDESIGQSKMRTTNVKNCEEDELVLKLGTFHSKEIKRSMPPFSKDSGIHTFSEGNVPGNLSRGLASNSVLPAMPCFSTASDKAVTLSEEAVRKAQEIFSEIENCPLQQDKTGDNLSEDPLSKVHTSSQRKPKEKTTLETSEIIHLPDAAANTFGFSTAGGKRVSVSETAIQKVKELFEGLTEPEHLQEHCPSIDKGDSDINKKANMLTQIVNKPENITRFSDQLGDLQTYRASSVKNKNADGPPFSNSTDIQRPMRRYSTPFHNAGVPGKSNFVSAITSRTPENYFEIEAAESAKAFMDDEDLSDGIRATEATNKNLRNGKRLRSDDRTPHGRFGFINVYVPKSRNTFLRNLNNLFDIPDVPIIH